MIYIIPQRNLEKKILVHSVNNSLRNVTCIFCLLHVTGRNLPNNKNNGGVKKFEGLTQRIFGILQEEIMEETARWTLLNVIAHKDLSILQYDVIFCHQIF